MKDLMKMVSGLVVGGLIFTLLLLAFWLLLRQPQVEVMPKPLIDEIKQDVAQSEANISIKLTLGQIAKPEFAASKPTRSTRPLAEKEPAETAVKLITLDNAVVKQGQDLLAKTKDLKLLPMILGDYKQLGGSSAYLAAMHRSGGRLFLFDRTGRNGVQPLIELAISDFNPVSGGTGGYSFERPRFLQPPYVSGLHAKLVYWQRRFPEAQIVPALVLPHKLEIYLLGALKSGLQSELSTYRALRGTYLKGGRTGLKLRVTSGLQRENAAQGYRQLKKPFEIEIGRLN